MTDSPFIGFTGNYEDNSTDAGFQFTFFCDICREGYKTGFIASKTYKKPGSSADSAGSPAAAASMAGKYSSATASSAGRMSSASGSRACPRNGTRSTRRRSRAPRTRPRGISSAARSCKKWVCENDWNEQEGLCVECAPRMNVEVAAARARKMVEDIQDKAKETPVFTGEIESKQTLCPQCGKPAGQGQVLQQLRRLAGHGQVPEVRGQELGPAPGSAGNAGRRPADRSRRRICQIPAPSV